MHVIDKAWLFNNLAKIPISGTAQDYATKVYQLINDAPTTELDFITRPDIIKCMNCKHADFSGCPEGRLYCMENGTYWDELDYCSSRERDIDE